MSFKSSHPTSERSLSRFEEEIGFDLPDSYRRFLMQHNGGVFERDYPIILIPNCPTLCVGSLFGLEMPNALNLAFWFRRYREELPGNSLLIGGDPGGAFYLLICSGTASGVYFSDHGHELPSSSREKNSYLVSPTFEAFAERIGLSI